MILLIGASACGKTEIALTLAKKYGIKKAITHTSREMRPGEIDGVDYYFVSDNEFINLIRESAFIETTIYNGHYYGCSKAEISDDKCVVVDPNGLKSFNLLNNPHIISFYLYASEEVRKERMLERGDKGPQIEDRIRIDRLSFDKNSLDRVDFEICTAAHDVDQLAYVIYSLYKRTLKERDELAFAV